MLSLIVSFLFCHLWYCCSFFGVLVQYWYSWILGLRPSGCQFSNISTLSWSTFIGIKRSPFPKVVSGTADWLSYSLTWGLTLLLNRYGSPLLLPISSSLWAWLWNHLTSGAGSFQGGSRIALLHGVNCSWEIFLYSLPHISSVSSTIADKLSKQVLLGSPKKKRKVKQYSFYNSSLKKFRSVVLWALQFQKCYQSNWKAWTWNFWAHKQVY